MALDKNPNGPATQVNENVVKFLLTWKPICNDRTSTDHQRPSDTNKIVLPREESQLVAAGQRPDSGILSS